MAAFTEALRASQLTTLILRLVNLFEPGCAGTDVVAACVGHPTLRELAFEAEMNVWADGSRAAMLSALGQACAALIVADSALESLSLSVSALDDGTMKPLFAAVADGRARLRELDLSHCTDDVSMECVADVILPAVRANTSLRKLQLSSIFVCREYNEAGISESNEAVDIHHRCSTRLDFVPAGCRRCL